MKVVLLEDIISVGKKWDIVEVKDGYARNFLIPKKMALPVNQKKKKEYENLQKIINYQKEKDKRRFLNIYELLNEKVFVMKTQTTEIGTLYSAIDVLHIAKFLSETTGKTISPDFLELEYPIKEVGSYKVFLNYNAESKGYFWVYVVSV